MIASDETHSSLDFYNFVAGFPTGKRADLMQLSGTIPVTIVGEIQAHNIDTSIKPYI